VTPGHALDGQGKQAEAEELFRRSFETVRRVLGKGHRDALRNGDCLGAWLERQGRLAEASQLRGEMEQVRQDLRQRLAAMKPGDDDWIRPPGDVRVRMR
jgi:hypothetical protein